MKNRRPDLDLQVHNVVRSAPLKLAVDAGPGNDRVQLSVVEPRIVPPNPVHPLRVDVLGEDGDDDLGLDLKDINRAAPVFVTVQSGQGNDTANVLFSDFIPVDPCRMLRVHVDGGDGNDRVHATFHLTPVDPCVGDLVVRGGRGNDDLGLFLSGVSDLRRLRALIDGGAGFDTASFSDGVAAKDIEEEPVT